MVYVNETLFTLMIYLARKLPLANKLHYVYYHVHLKIRYEFHVHQLSNRDNYRRLRNSAKWKKFDTIKKSCKIIYTNKCISIDTIFTCKIDTETVNFANSSRPIGGKRLSLNELVRAYSFRPVP